MGEIQLTRGLYTIVDSELLDWLCQWKWQANKSYNTYYALRHESRNSRRYYVPMHRAIMEYGGYDICDKQVDHKDGNGLNNRRYNLRIATNRQNAQNRPIPASNTSGYKGVSLYKRTGKWWTRIRVNGRLIHIGYFTDITEAAVAYDTAARHYFGEFARTNFLVE